MAKRRFKSIAEAEKAIKVLAEIRDQKIIVPDNIHDFRGQPEYDRWWDAYVWLRSEHDYESSTDDVLAEFDIDEFLDD